MLRFINQFILLNQAVHVELKAIIDAINLNLEKNKQRRQLIELDDRLLNDIGINRKQAIAEAHNSND